MGGEGWNGGGSVEGPGLLKSRPTALLRKGPNQRGFYRFLFSPALSD